MSFLKRREKLGRAYYAYVLISKDGKRTYTGHTENFKKRLKEHNAGEVKSSKQFRPYEILVLESFKTLKEAKEKELFYKSSTGRYRLRKIVMIWKLESKKR